MSIKMKFLSLAALFTVVFASCKNEPSEPLYHAFATVENPDSTRNYLLFDDDDESRLKPVNASRILKDGQRVYTQFRIVEERSKDDDYQYGIEYTYLYEILTKEIFNVTEETQDSIGKDLVFVRNMWIARDFLNFDFIFRADNPAIKHFINLVFDESKTYNDDKIHLEFRHNAKGDQQLIESAGLASFNLLPLREKAEGDSVNIVVHWHEYGSGNERKHEITYKFNNEESNPEPAVNINESGFIIE